MTQQDKDRRQSIAREQDEPEELNNPTPWPLLLLAAGLVIWGVWYYFANAGFPIAAGDRRTAIQTPTIDQVDGAQVYAANCVACHQGNGAGLAGVFPPLAESRWVLGSEERLVGIMLYGIQGNIEVQGMTYNGVMPAFARLSDAELAAVTTHIRSTWGNDANPISVDAVAAGRERDPDRSASWAGGEELISVFGDD